MKRVCPLVMLRKCRFHKHTCEWFFFIALIRLKLTLTHTTAMLHPLRKKLSDGINYVKLAKTFWYKLACRVIEDTCISSLRLYIQCSAWCSLLLFSLSKTTQSFLREIEAIYLTPFKYEINFKLLKNSSSLIQNQQNSWITKKNF